MGSSPPRNTTDFAFEIEEVHEIAKDPEGHHHHFTVFIGKLRVGSVSVGDLIQIPTTLGNVPTQIGGLDQLHKELGSTLHAASFTESFALMTRCPAVSDSIVIREVTTSIDPEAGLQLSMQHLKKNPSIYLHYIARDGVRYPWLCGECVEPLLRSAELFKNLQDLTQSQNLEISAFANQVLQSHCTPRTNNPRTRSTKSRPWWRFWQQLRNERTGGTP